jgi:hypothetical protein
MMGTFRFQKIYFIALLMGMVGCASINSSNYIQPENPYKRTYYGSFDDVLEVVRATVREDGWQIAKEVDPTLYERNPLYSAGDQGHILILTDIKRAQRIIYSKATNLNIYIHRIAEGVEVDIRYGSVKNFHLWKVRSYRNNALIKKMLDHIEQNLLLKK